MNVVVLAPVLHLFQVLAKKTSHRGYTCVLALANMSV